MSDYSRMPEAWVAILPEEGREALAKIMNHLENAISDGLVVVPDIHDIFKPFHLTSPKNVKCVILDVCPYCDTVGAADGLAYSCASASSSEMFPFSLNAILKELKSDMGYEIPTSGDLSKWAAEGVLLMNITGTAIMGNPTALEPWGWRRLTANIIKGLNEFQQPIIFHTWGEIATRLCKPSTLGISSERIIALSHPSPRGVRKGFFMTKPFSRTNALLERMGAAPINWDLNI